MTYEYAAELKGHLREAALRAWSPYGLMESNMMANADEFADRPLPFVHLLVLTPCCCPFSQRLTTTGTARTDQASVLCNLRAALHALEQLTRPWHVVVENVNTSTVTIALSCELGRHTQYSWVTFVYCPRRMAGGSPHANGGFGSAG